MTKWIQRIRGALGMGVTWAIAWAAAGLAIGVASIVLPGLPWDAFFAVFDAPLPALAVPGFFAGVFFSLVLGLAGRHRSFRELSLPRFIAWGAAGGVLLILFPFALVGLGLASREGSGIGTWQILAAVGGPFVLLSAGSAAVTLLLARRAEERGSRGTDGIPATAAPAGLDSARSPGLAQQPERLAVRLTAEVPPEQGVE
jgi:hypothetical protein